jgi:hypothetical protein
MPGLLLNAKRRSAGVQPFFILIAMVELPIPGIEISLGLEALVQCVPFQEGCIDLKLFAQPFSIVSRQFEGCPQICIQ